MFEHTIYFLFYLGSLIIILLGIGIRRDNKTEILSKDESNYIKGIATLMVFLAHSQDFLATNGSDSVILKPFSVFGGMGVLLFFFLSGFGIYKGYTNKTPSIKYWKNRLLNVLIPALFISIISCLIISFIEGKRIGIGSFLYNVVSSQWYIDVIMIEYLIFFIVWFCFYKNKNFIIIFSMILSFCVCIVFWKVGLNARWYNGIMLFPFGMAIASAEKKIIDFPKRFRCLMLISSILGFAISGLFFTRFKGQIIGDIIKTISGIFLAVSLLIILFYFKTGNKIVYWIGQKSLYIYLCHIYILTMINTIIKKGYINISPEAFIIILLFTSLGYATLMSLVFSRRRK